MLIDFFKMHWKLFVLQFVIVLTLLIGLPVAFELMATTQFESHKVLSSLRVEHFTQTRLGLDLIHYVVALFLTHLIFTSLIWLQSCYLYWRSDWVKKRLTLIGIGLTCLSVWWSLLLNAHMYPRSSFASIASPAPDSGALFSFTLMVSTCLFIGMMVVSFWALIKALCQTYWMVPKIENVLAGISSNFTLRKKACMVSTGLLVTLILCLNAYLSKEFHPSQFRNAKRPNIILFGIDSLRHDRVGLIKNENKTLPNIDQFIKESVFFETAYTPLARTFCAWTSILTGTYPTKHGARFNLISKETLDPDIRNLAQMYQTVGYDTVYATDEKRFSNIDTSYGFNKVIGPPIGAADFLLGSLNDFPLPNLISNTIAGKILFPYTYANRAAEQTYRTETFVDLVNDDLPDRSDSPLFLAVHLCLPHFPYKWSVPYAREIEDEYIPAEDNYANALKAADSQFSSIMKVFEKKGYLENAIVVLLSDHGESFESDKALFVNREGKKAGIFRSRTYGHGTNVISRQQHQVILAFKGFGIEGFQPGVIPQPAGLIDIAPTLLHFSPVPSANLRQFDGISLHPWVENRSAALRPRSFFVESGFSVPAILSNSPDLSAAFKQGAKFYTVSDSGYVTIKPNSLDLLLSKKQFGMYTGSRTYAVIPDIREGRKVKELLVDHKTNEIISDKSELRSQRNLFCEHFASESLVQRANICQLAQAPIGRMNDAEGFDVR